MVNALKQSKGRFKQTYCVFVLIVTLNLGFVANADTINVAAGWARPPYINPIDHTGFELDIIRQVLSKMGHKTKVVYVPHHNTIQMLKAGQVHMALTLNEGIGIHSSLLSAPYIDYQNVVLSLKGRGFKINELRDLSMLRVIGFQSAKDVLGDEYAVIMKGNNLYFEMADQEKQVELLLQGSVDAIVVDLNVFDYLSKKLTGKSQFEKIKVHPFFDINSYRVGFSDKIMKNAFDVQLKNYLVSDTYKKLKTQYGIKQITPVLSYSIK